MRKILAGVAALGLVLHGGAAWAQEEELGAQSEAAHAEGEPVHYPIKKPPSIMWSFGGPFGTFDKGQLQRGLKVYREVCAACHGLEYVAFRTLEEALGYSEGQVRALAAEYTVQEGPNADGEMFERPAIPSDYFPSPYPNVEAAAAANNGAAPPDLSLIAKARGVERGFPTFVFDLVTQYAENGPDYLYGLLTGYGETPPPGLEIPEGTYYNPYFIAGPALAMPPPLQDGQVTYDDDAPQTVAQYSADVTAFLMWAAEPHMEDRKRLGFQAIIFLAILGILVWLVKRRIWATVEH
ncbi:MAG TPA: cytochrome c1 [Mesorhizobium sp.]|nr:cytochrome c1 [Mesorhizobium sp.]